MATTASSSEFGATGQQLRLELVDRSGRVVALPGAMSKDLALPEVLDAVVDQEPYRARLACRGFVPSVVRLTAGEGPEVVFQCTSDPGGEGVFLLHPLQSGPARPDDFIALFKGSFDDVRLAVDVRCADGEDREIFFAPVPVAVSSAGGRAQNVTAMIESLGSGDRAWALAWAQRGDGVKLADTGGLVRGVSDEDLLAAAVDVVTVFERRIPEIRAKPWARTTERSAVVPARKARRVEAASVRWLATHRDVLTPSSGRKLRGLGTLRPKTILSTAKELDCNNRENRAMMALASDVCRRLRALSASLGHAVEDALAKRMRYERVRVPEGTVLAAMAVPNAYIESLRPFREEVDAVLSRANRVLMSLRVALPGVVLRHGEGGPRWSPAWASSVAYLDVFEASQRWAAVPEDSDDAGSLVLSAKSAPDLYESWALVSLLSALRSFGFEPVPGGAAWCAWDAASKTVQSRLNNRYELMRKKQDGSVETARIWYEPACSAVGISDCDVPLVRSGFLRWEWSTASLTPDYVLEVSNGEDSQVFVLDAKFSTPEFLFRFKNGHSIMEEVLVKYRLSLKMREPIENRLREPDAVIVLAGAPQGDRTWYPWDRSEAVARHRRNLRGDGVVVCSPGLSGLDEVLRGWIGGVGE